MDPGLKALVSAHETRREQNDLPLPSTAARSSSYDFWRWAILGFVNFKANTAHAREISAAAVSGEDGIDSSTTDVPLNSKRATDALGDSVPDIQDLLEPHVLLDFDEFILPFGEDESSSAPHLAKGELFRAEGSGTLVALIDSPAESYVPGFLGAVSDQSITGNAALLLDQSDAVDRIL